jgi:glyoxylase I family protein
MNFTVEHIGLAARNPIALKDWYVRTLGGKVIFDDGRTPPAFFVELPGGLILEIYRSDLTLKETAINTLAGWRHIALLVDSIEITKVELEAKGVSFTEPIKPAGGGGQVLYFKDAEDNLIHLLERPVDSPLAGRA